MVEHVGGLRDESGAVALDGRDRRLDRLLAELLRRRGGALGEELRRVGLVRRGLGPLGDDAGKVGEREAGGMDHEQRRSRPAI